MASNNAYAQNPYQTLYTGNNVKLSITTGSVTTFPALAENITVSRSVGRTPRYAVGDPRWVDAPVGQLSVTVSATVMIPTNALNGLPHADVNPSGSLIAELEANPSSITVMDKVSGVVLYKIDNCYYNSDTLQLPAADILSGSIQWLAQDTEAWR